VKDGNDCIRIAEATLQKLFEAEAAIDWKPISYEDPGFQGLNDVHLLERDLEGSPVRAGLATGTLPVDPQTIFDKVWAYDVEWTKKIDPHLVLFVKILEVNDDVQLVRIRAAAIRPVSNREFICVRCRKVINNIRYIYSVSVNYPQGDADSDPNSVRGVMQLNGFIFRPVEGNPNHVFLKRIVQIDPKGSVPLWIVDMMKRKAADFVVKLREESATLAKG